MDLIMGMNSGSSFDGIDVILAETEMAEDGFPKAPRFICGGSYEWPKEVADIVQDAFVNKVDMVGLNRLNYLCGAVFQEGLRGKGLYRTLLYLPSILPFVIIGLIFKSILNYNTGLLNTILDALHLGILKQKWLSDLGVVWKSIYGVDAWRGIGYVMTIFLAGLNTIPKSYYEAAEIDGANFWQRLRYVTLPMLTGSIMINLVFGITYGLKVFDIVYVLTNGGPGHATEVLTTYAFQLYSRGQYGMSSALNTILLIITAIIGVGIVKKMSKQEVQQ